MGIYFFKYGTNVRWEYHKLKAFRKEINFIFSVLRKIYYKFDIQIKKNGYENKNTNLVVCSAI
jgi:hypothetical protein